MALGELHTHVGQEQWTVSLSGWFRRLLPELREALSLGGRSLIRCLRSVLQ